MTTRPVLRLRPKMDPRRIRHGFPWVYQNEVVLDRRARAIAPGTIATLEDNDRRPLATITVNPGSKITGRVLSRDPEAVIDREWLAKRIDQALALRETLYDAPFYRLIHAEADGLPGVIIDRFGDAIVVQPNAAWVELQLEPMIAALQHVTGCATVVVNATSRIRKLEGLGERLEVVAGEIDGPLEVPMNGATYLADLTTGQKTGLFFDQRPNHAFVQRLSKDARVLDVFCHVGGFGLAALANGAREVIAVDGSAPALELATRGAKIMGVADRFETRKSDAFDALSALEGEQFDVVVCDPPAFAPNKKALDAGLRAYQRTSRMAAKLVRPGGYLTLCSCSHAAGVDSFHKANTLGIARAGRSAALIHSGRAGPDHPVHSGLPETSYLKAMVYRITA